MPLVCPPSGLLSHWISWGYFCAKFWMISLEPSALPPSWMMISRGTFCEIRLWRVRGRYWACWKEGTMMENFMNGVLFCSKKTIRAMA